MIESKKHIIVLLLLLVYQVGFAQKSEVEYSFFTAGHAYGNPNHPQLGLYPVFMDALPELNENPNIELAFLTGDFVLKPTAEYYNAALLDLEEFSMPYYIAAGNHDVGALFQETFNPYFFSFQHREDLFIILTPGLDKWNIEDEQLSFLQETLESHANQSRHIFIMMHELIWWSPTNIFQDVVINWEPHYPGHTNYSEVVEPLLNSYDNQIFLYAGDLGCTSQRSPCMYYQSNNLHLIASGLGSGNKDNIIITEISDGDVYLNLVAINGDDPKAMGELTDWTVNLSNQEINKEEINIFPNPSSSFIHINSTKSLDSVRIYNSTGKHINTIHNVQGKINTSFLEQGIYILEIISDSQKYYRKLIIKSH